MSRLATSPRPLVAPVPSVLIAAWGLPAWLQRLFTRWAPVPRPKCGHCDSRVTARDLSAFLRTGACRDCRG
jgi:hypothetical protein